jgi:hypothetical protein
VHTRAVEIFAAESIPLWNLLAGLLSVTFTSLMSLTGIEVPPGIVLKVLIRL